MNARAILKAVEAAILDERRQKKRLRDARYYAKRKASKNVERPTQMRAENVERRGKDALFRGITWRDVPGHDEAAKKMRFSLLKRGDWTGYKTAQYLEGEALKAAFAKINESQKAKSRLAATKRTAEFNDRNTNK